MDNLYAILWFEDNGDTYTLVDDQDKTVVLTPAEVKAEAAAILNTEAEVEDATPGVRYAVPIDLLDEVFGWTA